MSPVGTLVAGKAVCRETQEDREWISHTTHCINHVTRTLLYASANFGRQNNHKHYICTLAIIISLAKRILTIHGSKPYGSSRNNDTSTWNRSCSFVAWRACLTTGGRLSRRLIQKVEIDVTCQLSVQPARGQETLPELHPRGNALCSKHRV